MKAKCCSWCCGMSSMSDWLWIPQPATRLAKLTSQHPKQPAIRRHLAQCDIDTYFCAISIHILKNIFKTSVNKKKSFDLRSLNFTPLERGDQSLKEKFYLLASGANISLWGEFSSCIDIALCDFNGVFCFRTFGPMYRYRTNVSISHYMLLHIFSGEKTGVYSFLCSTLLGLCRSYQQVYRARVVLVGKSFQRPTFSCVTGCSMIFRCHFIEQCIDIALHGNHTFFFQCDIAQGRITP